MRLFKILSFLLLLFKSTSIVASSRKSSVHIPTLLTDYVLLDSHDNILNIRYDDAMFSEPIGSQVSFEDDQILHFSRRESIYQQAVNVPELFDILEEQRGLTSLNVINAIQNNDDFRRDHLNSFQNQSNSNNKYFIAEQEVNNHKDYYLAQINPDTDFKIIKKLDAQELSNLQNIEEEITYNSILYELPTRTINIENSINTLNQVIHNWQSMGLWTKGFTNFNSNKKSMTTDAFKAQNFGGIIGYNMQVSNDERIGLAYSKNQSATKFTASCSKELSNVDALSLSHKFNSDIWNSTSNILGGYIFTKNSRDLIYDDKKINSKHYGHFVSISTNHAKKYHTSKLNDIIPSISLNYTNIVLNPFLENGVIISKEQKQHFKITPTLILKREITVGQTTITPSVFYSASFTPYQQKNRSSVYILKNKVTLKASDFAPERETYNVGAGIDIAQDKWSTGVNYTYSLKNIHSIGLSIAVTNNYLKSSVTVNKIIDSKNRSHSVILEVNYNF